MIIRPAVVDDIPSMARVHVNSWRQAHRGIAPDALLDDPDLLRRREEFWLAALTDERWSQNRVAVAARDGALVGVAMSGPPLDDEASWDWQLYLVYVDHAHHGAGVGHRLLDAVLTPHESVALWVATRNVQAQAFYRRHGFRPDGLDRSEGGIRITRWSRPADPDRPRARRRVTTTPTSTRNPAARATSTRNCPP